MNSSTVRHIAILGSTGSIGTQALDVVSQHPQRYKVELLTCNSNSKLLIEQARKFNPTYVVICDDCKTEEVRDALSPLGIGVYTGIDAICELVKMPQIDIVLTAMVGFSGVRPTIAAIEASKRIALANKETLVAAGEIITSLAKRYGSDIIPVDSEHSAIYQSLRGENSRIEKILLTGSGGPFLMSEKEEIFNATKERALKHPRWKMGAKVTIDSASMMNKGLEMIEAKWLFDVTPKEIEVVVHPQSIIHSMVQFADGAIIAQMGEPDMRIPIQYAISLGERWELNTPRTHFPTLSQMTFFAPDLDKFPCLRLAYEAVESGGNTTCIMNAANEVAVAAFLQDKIKFGEIPHIISQTIERVGYIATPTIDDIFETDKMAQIVAKELV